MTIEIRIADYDGDRPALQTIRRTVFLGEQNVPEALDFDGKDEQCQHFLAEVDGQAVATLRLRQLDPQTTKIERVAVLKSHRRQGIAFKMMELAIAHLRTQGIQTLQVHAQSYIQPLYDRLQFETQGESFFEAGIEHVKMVRCI